MKSFFLNSHAYGNICGNAGNTWMTRARRNRCRRTLLGCHIRISEKHTEEDNDDSSDDDENNNNNL